MDPAAVFDLAFVHNEPLTLCGAGVEVDRCVGSVADRHASQSNGIEVSVYFVKSYRAADDRTVRDDYVRPVVHGEDDGVFVCGAVEGMTVEVESDCSAQVDVESAVVAKSIVCIGEIVDVEAFVGVCFDVAVEGDDVGEARLKGLRPCFGKGVEALDALAAHCVRDLGSRLHKIAVVVVFLISEVACIKSPLLLFSSITLL